MFLEIAHCWLKTCLEVGDGEDPNDASTVQAMPIIVHLPKTNPPGRTALLEAAAKATVMCCLDERAGRDTAYAQALRKWYGARIRKIARRARNVAWERVHDVPGVTAEVGTAQARACVPTAIVDTHPLVSRLQIHGTELPPDTPGPLRKGVPTIFINADLGMSLGKAAAQVGHGAMILATHMDYPTVKKWADSGFDLQVRSVPENEFRQLAARIDAVTIQDAGYTEVAPGTTTVVAVTCT